MTLIAINVQPRHAEILTDTLSYDANGRTLGRTTKVHLAPHADMAVLSQGYGLLGHVWVSDLRVLTEDVHDIDGLDRIAPDHLAQRWAEFEQAAPDAPKADTTVWHVGHSPERGRFVAYAYCSLDNFRRVDVTEDFVMTPALPSGAVVAPRKVEQWVALAKRARRERALAPVWEGKVFVGGDVLLTRLELGSVTQRVVHRFDDTGEEFRRMVQGTLHPLGQLGPCVCGSGRQLVLCHGLPASGPCTCGSGQMFGECCRVEPGAVVPQERYLVC